jgi:hypothetical protein
MKSFMTYYYAIKYQKLITIYTLHVKIYLESLAILPKFLDSVLAVLVIARVISFTIFKIIYVNPTQPLRLTLFQHWYNLTY